MSLVTEIILGGIRYKISEHEGLIVFSQKDGFYGTHCRICFEHPKDSLWYLSFTDTWGKIPVCHVIRAFEIVKKEYGGDFEQALKGE